MRLVTYDDIVNFAATKWSQAATWDSGVWFGVVGSALGVVGLAFGLWAWWKPRYSKIHCWQESRRILRLPQGSAVKVVVEEKRIERLTLSEFVFRNSGPQRIDADDIELAPIIDCGGRTIVDVSVKGGGTFEEVGSTVKISPAPLDPRAEFRVLILHDGEEADFQVSPGSFKKVPGGVTFVADRSSVSVRWPVLVTFLSLAFVAGALFSDQSTSGRIVGSVVGSIFVVSAWATRTVAGRRLFAKAGM